MLRHAIYVFALTCLSATGALAVHLSDVEGSVLVNEKNVEASLDVAPGDRVKAVSGAAKIVYDNGTVVSVPAGQTVVVLQNPPDLPVLGLSSKDPEGDYMVAGFGETGYLLGGALVVGAGVGTAALTGNSHGSGGGGQGPSDGPGPWSP
jgi:hypothetical protein